MSTRRVWETISWVLFIMLLVGCRTTPTFTETPRPTPASTATPTRTPTPRAAATPAKPVPTATPTLATTPANTVTLTLTPTPTAVASATSSPTAPRPTRTLDLAPGVSGIITCDSVNPLDPRCLGKIPPWMSPPEEAIHRFLHAARASDFETAQAYWIKTPLGGWTSLDQREMEIRRAMTVADWNLWGTRGVTQWVEISPEPPYLMRETSPGKANAAIVRMIPVRSDQSGGYEWAVLKVEGGWRLWRLIDMADAPSPTPTVTPWPTPTPVEEPLPQGAAPGRIAFVRGGALWVAEVGQERVVDPGPDVATPRWSPDGNWLAYRRQGQVRLATADGSEILQPEMPYCWWTSSPWSPTGHRLACRDNDDALWLVSPDGSSPQQLLPGLPAGYRVIGFAWSPDDEELAYTQMIDTDGAAGYRQGLWRVRVEDGDPVEVYDSGFPEKGEVILAGWSPKGEHLLFWQGDFPSASLVADGVPLYSVPVEGGDPVQVAETMLLYDDYRSWSPDGRLILVEGGGRDTWMKKHLLLTDAVGNAPQQLTGDDVIALSPAWSPDGSHIAWVGAPATARAAGGEAAQVAMGLRSIWVMDASGEDRRQLTSNPAWADDLPRWSADGRHILFVRRQEDRAELWVVQAEGQGLHPVVVGLTPVDTAPTFGYYGHFEWESLYDWWTEDSH